VREGASMLLLLGGLGELDFSRALGEDCLQQPHFAIDILGMQRHLTH
jgi:hypothetical protein